MKKYHKDQELNEYVKMLNDIYWPIQNYSKSKYEILTHLYEVFGVCGKFLFKDRDFESAANFVPKMFGWACALLISVKNNGVGAVDLHNYILRKFPKHCPYCLKQKCECSPGADLVIDADILQKIYYEYYGAQERGVKDFELMFSNLYSHTWERNKGNVIDDLRDVYIRMSEELSELSESLRFYHLYPKNFENEFADFIAWWFALSSTIRRAIGENASTTEGLLWRAYPGQCGDCHSNPCSCAQGPVREVMSRPHPAHYGESDALTGLRNQAAYDGDLEEISSDDLMMNFPMGCIRIDVDKFKSVNDSHGHNAGDTALKHIATILLKRARPKDRIYRISGDEFGILLPDTTEEEAFGLMKRVLRTLNLENVRWVSAQKAVVSFPVTVSVGVAEASTASDVNASFELADSAVYAAKDNGGNRIVKASDLSSQAGKPTSKA